ncbi:MAG: hypothetical protein KDA67_13005 [Rhodobacteraceae bacterium]|nr:hypothetical protein [Paracoccaceae bacterium]
MQANRFPITSVPLWQRVVAIIALIFGALTLFSGGSILFGPESARAAAGNYVPFVLWFNFIAGLFYVLAAVGIWLGRAWALPLSIVIALATLLIALLFLYHILVGEAYEMRTVVALGLRTGVWGVIALALYRRQK